MITNELKRRSNRMKKNEAALATIKLDGHSGRGELFWHNDDKYGGQIWLRKPNGEEYYTAIPCNKGGALEAIRVVWAYWGWDLQVVE